MAPVLSPVYLPKTILGVCMHVRTDGFKFQKKNFTLSSECENSLTVSGSTYIILSKKENTSYQFL